MHFLQNCEGHTIIVFWTMENFDDHTMNYGDHAKKHDCHAVIMASSWPFFVIISSLQDHGKTAMFFQTGFDQSITRRRFMAEELEVVEFFDLLVAQVDHHTKKTCESF